LKKETDVGLQRFVLEKARDNMTAPRHFFIPGLDNTRLFMSFTAGAGTRCMTLLSSAPILKVKGIVWTRSS